MAYASMCVIVFLWATHYGMWTGGRLLAFSGALVLGYFDDTPATYMLHMAGVLMCATGTLWHVYAHYHERAARLCIVACALFAVRVMLKVGAIATWEDMSYTLTQNATGYVLQGAAKAARIMYTGHHEHPWTMLIFRYVGGVGQYVVILLMWFVISH